MPRSSIKKRSITDFLKFAILVFSIPAAAAKDQYQLKLDVRYGMHTLGEPTIATHRHTLEYEQKNEFDSSWSTVLGFRAEMESAYAATPDLYKSSDIEKTDAQTFLLRDNFLQYSKGSFRSRIGYQQVVWGETFGAYYADIVNPKDYREAGLGDLARNRLAAPMVNLQWIDSSSSFQVVYLPVASMNLLPSYGSDFNAIKLPGAPANVPLTIERKPASLPTQGEFGFRATQQISSYDLSLFYLNYHDRMPVYRLQVNPAPLSFKVLPELQPLQSVGGTLTKDFDGYLLRTELVEHINREMNTYDGVTLGSAKSDELVSVLGIDLPPQAKWEVSFQYAESNLRSDNWAFRQAKQSSLNARLGRTFSNEISFETLYSYFTSDASQLLQAKITFPVANQFEFLLGCDQFSGADTSELGRFKNANRIWVMYKATLRK